MELSLDLQPFGWGMYNRALSTTDCSWCVLGFGARGSVQENHLIQKHTNVGLAAPCWCKESFLGGINWKTTLPPNIVIFEPHLKLGTTSGGSAAGLHICIIRLHLSAWDSHWPRLNMAENFHQISIEMFQCDMLEGLPSKFCEYQNSGPTLPHPAPQDGPCVRYKWSSNPLKMAKNRLMHFPDIWYYII